MTDLDASGGGGLPDGDEFVDGTSIEGWSLISTILGSAFVFVGAKISGAAVFIVQLHLWVITSIGSGFSRAIQAVFGGGAYVNEMAWASAATQAEAAGVLAPWLLLLDIILVLGIIYAARTWGPIP